MEDNEIPIEGDDERDDPFKIEEKDDLSLEEAFEDHLEDMIGDYDD